MGLRWKAAWMGDPRKSATRQREAAKRRGNKKTEPRMGKKEGFGMNVAWLFSD